MTTKTESRYDVAIISMEDRKIVSIISKDLSESKADKREMTGLSRINLDAYFADSVPAGKYEVGDIYNQ